MQCELFSSRYMNSLNTFVVMLSMYHIIFKLPMFNYNTGGKPRNYYEIVLTQATSGTCRGSCKAENWVNKGWCHIHFCFILLLRRNNGEIGQCGCG